MVLALVLAGAAFALGPDGEIGACWSVVGPWADGVIELGTTRNGARMVVTTLVCAAPRAWCGTWTRRS